MTQKKHLARVALSKAAKALSEEIWEGKWDHLQEVESVPIGQWAEMAKELERRCPGHTLQEYRDAICREMVKH
jgi:hypothetical protein